MQKKLLCLLLTLCMVTAMLPLQVFANPAEEDEEKPNVGTKVTLDPKELELLMGMDQFFRHHVINGPQNAVRPGQATSYLVKFYSGERLIESIEVQNGAYLTTMPDEDKCFSIEGSFAGWYTDKTCETPFNINEPIIQDLSVYAKYVPVQTMEETLLIDSFSKTDVGTDFTLTVTGNSEPVVTLEAMDNTELPTLSVQSQEDGTYTISAIDGFLAGSSYELTLGEGCNFVGENGEELPETVRTASFTVEKAIVMNMPLNDAIVYLEDAQTITYTQVDTDGDGECDDNADILSGSYGLSKDGSKATVDGDMPVVNENDIICFFVGTHPNDRKYDTEDASVYPNEPAVYAKVLSVAENTITFTGLGSDDMAQVYNIPNVFPIHGKAVDGTVSIGQLDADMLGEFELTNPITGNTEDVEYAKSQLEIGDFVAIYEDVQDEDKTIIGRITGYDTESGVITFEVCGPEEVMASRDMYVQPALDSDEIITDADKAEIKKIMEEQITASGFMEEAAWTLANLATQTEGFRQMDNLRSVLLKDESGKPLTSEEIQLLNLGASFELTDDIKLSLELITKKDGRDLLHFRDGIQLAVGMEAKFEVDAEDGKVVIELNATFIQELEVKPTVNGSLTHKKVFGIKIPNGVQITTNIDVKNYTAYDFDVTAYTVEAEDEAIWKKVQDLVTGEKNIVDILKHSHLVPDRYAGQLKKAGDVFDKIAELEKKISDAQTKYKETKETIEGYNEDLQALTEIVDTLIDEGICQRDAVEAWQNSAEIFSKTNIAQELFGLTEEGINFEGDAGVDNDVALQTIEELMERYAELIQKETDWVKLLDKKICEVNAGVQVINFMLKVDFIIRANMSIALGSTLEYETGKRYTFWFKLGLYKPSSGSSTMDLIDESLAFQFYVMGKLDIKMGAKITLGISLGCADVAYAGVYAEVGPYVKLRGFFIYSYEKLRAAGAVKGIEKKQMLGALHLETGVYLVVGVEASALAGLVEASFDFVDKEFPILSVGAEDFPYAFDYQPQDGDVVVIRDSDGNSANGISMPIPASIRAVRTMALQTGMIESKIYTPDRYNVSFTDPSFRYDESTGEISVEVPDGTRYLECDMRLTYKYGKLAFSTFDIGVTVPVCWTNLSDAELNEFYTATVKVVGDGASKNVWSLRVRKNEGFALPEADEILELIGYTGREDLRYEGGDYVEGTVTDNPDGIIKDTTYLFSVTPKQYAVTVQNIGDTGTESKVFKAQLGQAFDFRALEGTGKNDPAAGEFTRFLNVTTEATIRTADGKITPIDLTSPITTRVAEVLAEGNVTARANYVDNSVTATFKMTVTDTDIPASIWEEDAWTVALADQKLRMGSKASIQAIEETVDKYGLIVSDITPDLNTPMQASTEYFVTLGRVSGQSYTVTFEENGGSTVEDITKSVGGYLAYPQDPTRTGYTFDTWYTDDGTFENVFTARIMPEGGTTVYAKWIPNKYEVSFDVNYPSDDSVASKTVTYDAAYGTLPKPAAREGFVFEGWYTDDNGGTKVAETDIYKVADDQTLYAKWRELETIPVDVFSLNNITLYIGSGGIDLSDHLNTIYGNAYSDVHGFTVKYMHSSGGDYTKTLDSVGTYSIILTRPEDNVYKSFTMTYNNALTVLMDGNWTEDGNYTSISTSSSVVYIRTAKQLAGLAYAVNSGTLSSSITSVELGADINLNNHWWQPIGTSTNPFKLSFDGNGHTIYGMYVDENADNQGLFGYCNDAEIDDLVVDRAEIEGGSNVGGIVGYAKATEVMDCVSYAEVSGSNFVGGIVGNAEGSTLIKNCENNGAIIGTSNSTGGIAGYVNGSTVQECENNGTINGGSSTGGIVGGLVTGSKLTCCINNANVTSTGAYTGGLVGYNGTSLVYNSGNFGYVKAGGEQAGGLVGCVSRNASSKVINCFNMGGLESTSNKYIGSVVGRNEDNDGYVLNCYYKFHVCCGADKKWRNALGTDDGSLEDKQDKKDHHKCAYFNIPDSGTVANDTSLSRGDYKGKSLLTALQGWEKNNSQPLDWIVDAKGNPNFTFSYRPTRSTAY